MAVIGLLGRLFLLFGMAASGLSSASQLPDTLERIRVGVVAIGTLTPIPHSAAKTPKARFTGTGFVVGNGRQIITNHHVIPETLDEKKGEVLAVFSGRGKVAKGRAAKVVRTDPDHDLALLEMRGPPLPALDLEKSTVVREGEEVAFTGFPLGMVLGLYPVTNRTIISAITPVVIPANEAKRLSAAQIRRLKTPYDVYQLDAIAYPGNSGSPVYRTESGRVIGVVNSVFVKGTKESMLETPSGISYAIPVRYIHELMGK